MTTSEHRPTWSDRLNPRNWTVTWKLLVVGLAPALLALVLGVLRVSDQAGAAGELGLGTRLLEVRTQVAGAADALRQERDQSALFVAASRIGDRAALDTGPRKASDGAIEQVRAAVLRASSLDRATTAAVDRAEGAFAALPALREDSATGTTGTDQVVARYSDVIDRVDELDRTLLRQLRTPDIAGLADALTAVTAASEQLALQHTVLGAAIAAGQLRMTDIATAAATDRAFAEKLADYEVALTPEQGARFGNFLTDEANADRERLKTAILATPSDRPVIVAPAEWDGAYSASQAPVAKASDGIRAELLAGGAAAQERASNLAGINSVILMLGLLVGITITILVARSLVRSLRLLRSSALDVAQRRLPQAVESMRAGEIPNITIEPVPLTSTDEIGQVARAFDAVHGQAVRLAADQATLQAGVSSMFVNLSRRSQALVERQLQLIEQLESKEEDPDQLANLFQLDSLATRMRRNSENLLVLAGTDVAKRNAAPVPLVDVLRAAVSEIEQYQRVVVQPPPTATVVGRAAGDVVHLLAELLDNATNFSPPDSQVVMSSTRTCDGSIVVEIADRGVGMADHELAELNQRLGGPSSVDVSVSRRMGLFVVGRLGARHGIGVRLGASASRGPVTGVTVSVTVPAYLIPSSTPVETGGPPATRTVWETAPSGIAPQRAGLNGSSRSGSLSSLVAGTDGPASSAATFDAPPGQGADGPRFPAMPLNGTGRGLPTRRPGSSLRRPAAADPPARGADGSGDDPPNRAEQELEQALTAEFGTPEFGPAEPTGPRSAEQGESDDGESDGARSLPPNGSIANGSTPNGSIPAAGDLAQPAPPTAPESPAAGPDGTAEPSHRPAADELFAPSVPVIAEPDAGALPPRPVASEDARRAEAFDLGATTPIFEEIASAWFRSNRPVPVAWETGQTDAEGRPVTIAGTSAQPAVPAAPEPGTPEPGTPEPAVPPITATEPDVGFASAADEGWRAASSVDARADRSADLTSAGLPKRRPRAHLVPGSAGSASPASPASSERSAESIRGRLASYQQGIRQGRESRRRRDPGTSAGEPPAGGDTEPASAGGHHDEESR